MFLVSGYWDPKADVNQSVWAVAKIIWRGELSVVHVEGYVLYYKCTKDSHKADLTVKRYVNPFTICAISSLTTSTRFVQIFKHCKALKKFFPKTRQSSSSNCHFPVIFFVSLPCWLLLLICSFESYILYCALYCSYLCILCISQYYLSLWDL